MRIVSDIVVPLLVAALCGALIYFIGWVANVQSYWGMGLVSAAIVWILLMLLTHLGKPKA